MLKFLPQKYLPLIVGFLLVLLAFFFFQRLSFEKGPKKEVTAVTRIEIDFSILESAAVRELEPFEKIKPFEGEIGRANPFLPY